MDRVPIGAHRRLSHARHTKRLTSGLTSLSLRRRNTHTPRSMFRDHASSPLVEAPHRSHVSFFSARIRRTRSTHSPSMFSNSRMSVPERLRLVVMDDSAPCSLVNTYHLEPS